MDHQFFNMFNRIETTEIINAIEMKYDKHEELSFYSDGDSFTIYRKNKLARLSLNEILDVLDRNFNLLNESRSKYDLVAEYLLNKLHKKKKPFPDIKELPKSNKKDLS